ncbi:hypothetical protein M413DRAFT_250023 [Hebeloma cylindrosporum]|uniref:Uncharacterized protein n=1 Tax=Hebeloma cylindrosporum TaxID=76867 RepID=A0A0C3C170_HEBCY|nr:hypothetical protein M413DRAFT_250023 [Hebeloma cylindrosporum h7]
MPPTSNERRCSWMLCSNQGKLRCSGCRDAEPQTVYCGEGCQKRDWKYHKKYCGRDAYTFDLTLLGTSNPVIKRTFDVPAWYTFRQLHYTLQYAMGPWDCTHLHEFSFTIPPSPPLPPPSSSLSLSSPSSSASTSTLNPTPTPTPTPSSRRPHDVFSKKEGKEVLRIGSKRLYDATRMPIPGEDAKLEMEESVLLQDVFDPAGKLYELVGGGGKGKTSGEVCALTYVYDFGVCVSFFLFVLLILCCF